MLECRKEVIPGCTCRALTSTWFQPQLSPYYLQKKYKIQMCKNTKYYLPEIQNTKIQKIQWSWCARRKWTLDASVVLSYQPGFNRNYHKFLYHQYHQYHQPPTSCNRNFVMIFVLGMGIVSVCWAFRLDSGAKIGFSKLAACLFNLTAADLCFRKTLILWGSRERINLFMNLGIEALDLPKISDSCVKIYVSFQSGRSYIKQQQESLTIWCYKKTYNTKIKK